MRLHSRYPVMTMMAWVMALILLMDCAGNGPGSESGSANETGQSRDATLDDGAMAGGLLDEQTYEEILIELLITNQRFTTQSDSAEVDAARRALFERFGASEAQFMASHRHYEQRVDQQMERMQRIKDRIQIEMMSISDHIREQEAIIRARRDSIRETLEPSRQKLRLVPGEP